MGPGVLFGFHCRETWVKLEGFDFVNLKFRTSISQDQILVLSVLYVPMRPTAECICFEVQGLRFILKRLYGEGFRVSDRSSLPGSRSAQSAGCRGLVVYPL